tara:strand:- start:1105 stop:1455 length:351 start_codon:yes stop_codon:yes gene_type:complete
MVIRTKNGAKPFVLQRRQAKLVFEEAEYEGLEILTKLDVSTKLFLSMQALTSSNLVEDQERAMRLFGNEVLISWNLQEEDGKKLPPDGDGFFSLPPNFAIKIITAWSEASGKLGEA